MEKQGITADELVELGQSCGFPVTQRKLQGWHKADLLPRPVVTRLGRGKGTASHYPTGTDRQLLALCRLHFGGGPHRRYGPLRVALWCEQFPIPIEHFKASAIALLQPLQQTWQNTKGQKRGKLDVAETFAEMIVGTTGRRGTEISRIPKRFRNEAVNEQSFWTALFRLALGDRDALSDGDGLEAELGELLPGQIVEKGLNLQAARKESVAGALPWLDGQFGDGLELLAAAEPDALRASIEKASEAELIQAREDWLGFHPMVTVATVLETITGADIFRQDLIESVTTKASPALQVAMIGFLLAIRKTWGSGDNIDLVVDALRNCQPAYDVSEMTGMITDAQKSDQ